MEDFLLQSLSSCVEVIFRHLFVCIFISSFCPVKNFNFHNAGVLFRLSHERIAVFIMALYSVYCGRTYIGWLGLLLGLNLSFISSDVLIFFLKNNLNEQRGPDSFPEQTAGVSADVGGGLPADHSAGIPSTSGSDSEMTSENEVIRLLNCADHYSALGLSRFQNVDVSILKREYRKKASINKTSSVQSF